MCVCTCVCLVLVGYFFYDDIFGISERTAT